MKILLTGANGYIAKRLLPALVSSGHHVVCCVRDASRLNLPTSVAKMVNVIEVDFLNLDSLNVIPKNIDAAYFLIHSMAVSRDFKELEKQCATNFKAVVEKTGCKHVIYLSGIVNENTLSEHLESRKNVEDELKSNVYHLTTFRAGIIIGSGSASFEIMRDLVEKLPFIVAPKWLLTRCQPIGIANVISILELSLLNEKTFDRNFDIGGPDILTYKEMLLGYAKIRGISRYIGVVPVMTPKLSSYWLYFITSTSYKLASALVDSMKVEVVCRDTEINQIIGLKPFSYEVALKRTMAVIEENQIISSWKDAFSSSNVKYKISDFMEVPTYGCFIDKRSAVATDQDVTFSKVWSIGGNTGWYFANSLWKIRGFIDKVWGGVGLRRGRTNTNQISPGDAIDFWRVLYASKKEKRLLMFAEMKLPGDAWLEFKILDGKLYQTATFRPKGIWGRVYWFALYPIHVVIFMGMCRKIASKSM
jgi:uncharacterized protein YbjT (DUF2867 family)